MTKMNNGHPIAEMMGPVLMKEQEKEKADVAGMLKALTHGRPILKLLIKQYDVTEVKRAGEKFLGFSENGLLIDKDQFYTGRIYKFRVRYQWGFYKFQYSFN